jgi:hypothetical protein
MVVFRGFHALMTGVAVQCGAERPFGINNLLAALVLYAHRCDDYALFGLDRRCA